MIVLTPNHVKSRYKKTDTTKTNYNVTRLTPNYVGDTLEKNTDTAKKKKSYFDYTNSQPSQ